jgi:protein phosphatase
MEGNSPQFSVATSTTTGRRSQNQDTGIAVRVDPGQNRWGFEAIIAVADGMGGHAAGDVASRIAADTVAEMLGDPHAGESETPSISDIAEPVDAVAEVVSVANTRIYEQAQEHRSQRDMGTTLTLIALTAQTAVVAHVGDSRGYLVGHSGIVQITQDHTWVAQQVLAERMTEEEAAKSPLRSQITRTLGAEPTVEADVIAIPLETDTAFLVCSDGLTEVVSPTEIEHELRSAEDVASACTALVEKADAAGASDNATVACAVHGNVKRAAGTQQEVTQELLPTLRTRARGRDERALQRLKPLFIGVGVIIIVALLLLVRSCMLAPAQQTDDDLPPQPESQSVFDLPPVENGLTVKIATIDGSLVAGANRHVTLTIHPPGDFSEQEPKILLGPDSDYTRALTEQQAANWADATCSVRIWVEGNTVRFESAPEDLDIYVDKKQIAEPSVSLASIGDEGMRVGFYFPANNSDGYTVALTSIDAANLPQPSDTDEADG